MRQERRIAILSAAMVFAATAAIAFAATAAIAFAATAAMAQGQRPALPGQQQGSDQPIQIDAKSLEVHDKNKQATFSGNVKVVQGDTTMTCKKLVVFYGQELGIGEKTVKTHVSNILAKLGVQSRTQAALHAVQIGLVSGKGIGGDAEQ